ncbi:MAG: Gx transporter family protein [Ruminococcaceae bacterium]|nr:Gx transporter family protein [Oscillospiraceae bacterium]
MKKTRVYFLCRLALLCALAIALSALEGVFTPLLPPFTKAGFSNVAVMLAAAFLGLPSALTVVLFKAAFALLTRGAVAAFLSLAGGASSALLLWLLFRYVRPLGVFGISILGAITHSAVQLLASTLLYGRAVLAYAPVMLLLSLPSGVITAALLSAGEHLFLHYLPQKRKDQDL